VKQSNAGGKNPDIIAAQVRTQVARALERLDFAPARPEFLERIQKLAATLALWGTRMNLTAQPDNPSEIAFHVVDSLMPLALAQRADAAPLRGVCERGRQILDLGSGAGFPGLVLAAACDASFMLCESRRKRASFLSIAVAEMVLSNVIVAPTRATPESFGPRFDVVIARAAGNLADFGRIAAASTHPGGIAILYAAPTRHPQLRDSDSTKLTPIATLEYEIDRPGAPVRRVIALWRRQ
jgi:16S rRNA (guanine527-N7)-methyltransferase